MTLLNMNSIPFNMSKECKSGNEGCLKNWQIAGTGYLQL